MPICVKAVKRDDTDGGLGQNLGVAQYTDRRFCKKPEGRPVSRATL
jgi:hypothetical protein